jgi:hypothetical protein
MIEGSGSIPLTITDPDPGGPKTYWFGCNATLLELHCSKKWNAGCHTNIRRLVGFGRACAPVRCAHPSFWAYYHPKRGAARPSPAHGSFSAFYSSPKNNNFKKQIASLLAQTREYLSAGLSCTPLGYTASYWATLHPPELHWTLISYIAPYWATLHPTMLCCIQLSYTAPCLSYAAFQELRCTLWAKLHPSELRCTLLNYAEPYLSYAGL